ncbi:GNAT family N-acetyltransferase [Massilia yuzhufengensis]|uniref:Acetyltransferase, GNAT family n=1 Tax=Massilia yuzhufengensis TaxID=1164594 RepID=A0A1I1D8S7_9BURK|nr:GNAT family N-acetyltransferase [Massilia yuzhufengensis]SFB71335.1 Acetyltransferase, GNAT family [Massilia yuzhufengensis]
MPEQRRAEPADLPELWALRTRAVRTSCASHYAPDVIDAWCAAPPPDRLPALLAGGGGLVVEEVGQVQGYAILDLATGELDAAFVDPAQQGRGIARRLLAALDAMAVQHGLRRLFLSASLNAVPFYQQAGYVALRRETYPHRSGLQLESVYMEKELAPLTRS